MSVECSTSVFAAHWILHSRKYNCATYLHLWEYRMQRDCIISLLFFRLLTRLFCQRFLQMKNVDNIKNVKKRKKRDQNKKKNRKNVFLHLWVYNV